MQEWALDPDVFIRSMATRGHMGGLATATDDIVTVLDGAGFDVVLVETVGVGQDEVDIIREADTVLVVLVPGMGDDIQAIKAGIMEIADIFVLNKADREGVDRLEREVHSMLALAGDSGGWTPPVVKTVASLGDGLCELEAALETHREYLAGSKGLEERRRLKLRQKFWDHLQERFRETVRRRRLPPAAEEALAQALFTREADPYTAADELLSTVLKEEEP
jgi:LAO/AO transport system kinase